MGLPIPISISLVWSHDHGRPPLRKHVLVCSCAFLTGTEFNTVGPKCVCVFSCVLCQRHCVKSTQKNNLKGEKTALLDWRCSYERRCIVSVCCPEGTLLDFLCISVCVKSGLLHYWTDMKVGKRTRPHHSAHKHTQNARKVL